MVLHGAIFHSHDDFHGTRSGSSQQYEKNFRTIARRFVHDDSSDLHQSRFVPKQTRYQHHGFRGCILFAPKRGHSVSMNHPQGPGTSLMWGPPVDLHISPEITFTPSNARVFAKDRGICFTGQSGMAGTESASPWARVV